MQLAVSRSFGHWMCQYRRTWRGTLVSSFVTPLLYLLALGVGLGSLVGTTVSNSTQAGYLAFVAPGLLAAAAVQTAYTLATFPVMSAMRWHRVYHAMMTAALGPADILCGHLAFMATRISLTCAVYVACMTALGLVATPLALLALPAAVLVGLACAAPMTALSGWLRRDGALTVLERFAVMPMFLFCGTFYPVSVTPAVLRPLVYVTPMWHGVELCRGFVAGDIRLAGAAGHTAVLFGWLLLGFVVAQRVFRRRLTQ